FCPWSREKATSRRVSRPEFLYLSHSVWYRKSVVKCLSPNISQFLPLCPSAALCCRNPLYGAIPVPAPTIITEVLPSSGRRNWLLDLILTLSLWPTSTRSARKVEHTPFLLLPSFSYRTAPTVI